MRTRLRKPSGIPYPTDAEVATGAELVKRVDSLVFVGEEYDDHVIHLLLKTGVRFTIKLRERHQRARSGGEAYTS